MQLAGITPDAIDAAELYSCFPAALQSFARDLEIPPGRPLSLTCGMPFAGGPFNHFAIEGVARMTEVLRDRARSSTRAVGIVANLSGIFGKQACTLLSTAANENGYGYADVTAAVAEEDVPVPLDPAYSGPATVAGYTVVFHKGAPSHAVAICDTPAGERTVARSDDAAWMQEMMETELCGTEVHVQPDGSFVRGATEVPGRST